MVRVENRIYWETTNRMDIIKNNYTDIDIYAEKPTANDRFLGRKL